MIEAACGRDKAMLLIGIAIATCGATLAGGLFALSLKDKRHLILGFSAGAVIAVAFFDLIPEAIDLGAGRHSPNLLLAATALGFLVYLLLDRSLTLHGDQLRGSLGAGSFSIHSFLDGLAIGLAFQASEAVGIVVAIGVLTHDFSDGINTLNIVLKNGGSRANALYWLIIDAIAPVLGVGASLLFLVPAERLDFILATFGGFFLYIGASDLIPESYHAHPKLLTTLMTLMGAGVLYLAVIFAGAG